VARASGCAGAVVEDARIGASNGRHRLIVRLAQTQEAAPFRLTVPVAVTLQGEATARLFDVRFDGGRVAGLDVLLEARPLRVDVDPGFDAFRRLAPGEVPPSLGTLFGAKRQVLVMPAAASPRSSRPGASSASSGGAAIAASRSSTMAR